MGKKASESELLQIAFRSGKRHNENESTNQLEKGRKSVMLHTTECTVVPGFDKF